MEEFYLNTLKQLREECESDPEVWHSQAEGVMLDMLRNEGYTRFADEYEEQSKNWWYA